MNTAVMARNNSITISVKTNSEVSSSRLMKMMKAPHKTKHPTSHMYAEAKIEKGEIDPSALDAMNMVRARAYGVDKSATSRYPAITTTDQTALRKILRIERRMEFALEELRYMDIIRWKLAEKVLTNNIYGMLDPAELRTKVVNKGLWFFPETPPIDEDGIPDFLPMYNKGLIKLLAIRKFDAKKEYLWPIPSSEVLINPNIVQNPGY